MGTLRLSVLGSLLFHIPCAFAADIPAPPEAAAPAKARYDAAVKKLKNQYDAAVLDSLRKFDELIAKAKASGQFDIALQIQDEKERANSDSAIGTLIPDAVSARKLFDSSKRKAKEDYEASARDLHAKFIKELSDLYALEVKADRTDSAKAVRSYRSKVEEVGPVPLFDAPPPARAPKANQDDYTLVNGVLTEGVIQGGVLYLLIDDKIYAGSINSGLKLYRWNATTKTAESVSPSDIRKTYDAWLCFNKKTKRWTKLLVGLPKEFENIDKARKVFFPEQQK